MGEYVYVYSKKKEINWKSGVCTDTVFLEVEVVYQRSFQLRRNLQTHLERYYYRGRLSPSKKVG